MVQIRILRQTYHINLSSVVKTSHHSLQQVDSFLLIQSFQENRSHFGTHSTIVRLNNKYCLQLGKIFTLSFYFLKKFLELSSGEKLCLLRVSQISYLDVFRQFCCLSGVEKNSYSPNSTLLLYPLNLRHHFL